MQKFSLCDSIENQFNAVLISSSGAAASPSATAPRQIGFDDASPPAGESLSTYNLIGGVSSMTKSPFGDERSAIGGEESSLHSQEEIQTTETPVSQGSKRKDDTLLPLTVIDPVTIGESLCGGIRGQAGKIRRLTM